MNGTFPYVLPNVCLPSEPIIEVMDAGVRDNYGMETTLNYMMHFSDWIRDNTSGVIILQLRDKFKTNAEDTIYPPDFKVDVSPLSAILGNVATPHNYVQDNLYSINIVFRFPPVEVLSLRFKT